MKTYNTDRTGYVSHLADNLRPFLDLVLMLPDGAALLGQHVIGRITCENAIGIHKLGFSDRNILCIAAEGCCE